jgi:hypothetical protein
MPAERVMMYDPTEPQQWAGMITDDPVKDLPAGSEIGFISRLFPFDAPNGLNDVSDWNYFRGTVIALHFGDVLEQRILGSGIIVAPGVAVVAAHVVLPEIERIFAGDGFLCSALTPTGVMFWRPRQVTPIESTDLAIVTLEYAAPLPDEFFQAVITTRTPRIGETILIAGHRYEGVSRSESGEMLISLSLKVAAGTVVNCYPSGRDRVMLPGPVFEADCPALSGMSGGPAFDRRGFLIGLLSSSMEGADAAGPSFVSSVWPVLGARLTPTWPSGFYQKPVSLLELDRRLCGIERAEAIRVTRDEVIGRFSTEYAIWNAEPVSPDR